MVQWALQPFIQIKECNHSTVYISLDAMCNTDMCGMSVNTSQ